MSTHSQEFSPEGLFQTILSGESNRALDAEFPFFAINSARMPLPGDNFLAAAASLGDAPPNCEGTGANKRVMACGVYLQYLYRQALYSSDFTLPVKVRSSQIVASCLPGHLISDTTEQYNGGPRPAKVMIIGKQPSQEDIGQRRNFVGATSQVFFDALHQLGVTREDYSSWYCTNLVKWPAINPQSTAIPKTWQKDWAIVLEQELRLVKPDYILCLGSDASKFLLGAAYGVNAMVGRVEDYPIHVDQPENSGDLLPPPHIAKVMAVTHPAQVYRTPELFDDFKANLAGFVQLSNGVALGEAEQDLNHVDVYTQRHLKSIVDEILNDPDPMRRIIAVDGEWHGDHYSEPGAYLRTIQFSSKHGEGINVVLRHQGGTPAFKPSMESAFEELRRLLKYNHETGWYPRVGGHFFRADLPWLINSGLDLRDEYAPADDINDRVHGGWDTSLLYHATNETASYALSDVMTRMTAAPRYDQKLGRWRTWYCKWMGIESADLEGYGMCPSWILHPYGSYDADVTRRIAVRCLYGDERGPATLHSDWFENDAWEAFWTAHSASLAFLEMEMTGLGLDHARADEITLVFARTKDRLIAELRQRLAWPTFNPGSTNDRQAFLFGDEFGRKKGPEGTTVSARPEGAMTMNLQPITTTGNRPKQWSAVVADGNQNAYSPSTGKEVLGIFSHEYPEVGMLRDVRFISQVLQSTLRSPITNESGLVRDADGFLVSEGKKGLVKAAHADGRIRTHLSQCKETGRASSYRPPLQNISKRRETDYSRIIGDEHKHPIRTLLRAAPGCVLVESDYTGAELAVLAWLSGDPTMIDHVRRNNLPEDHPEFYDIHSNTAVNAFRLSCAPTKTGLKGAGHKGLRVAAKNVNFGQYIVLRSLQQIVILGYVVYYERSNSCKHVQHVKPSSRTNEVREGRSTALGLVG